MRTRQLRRGGSVTEIGFGGAQVGNLYRPIDDDEAARAIEAAWDGGIRYFDTAPHYGLGLSERRLGAVLRQHPREEYTLSTKVGRLLVPTLENADQLDDDGFAVPATSRRVFDFSRDGILRSIEGSLDRLGVDRVDIAYLHDPDDHWDQASTTGISTLIELREQGVVRAIGAGMNQTAMPTEFIRRFDIDIVMIAGRYSLLDPSAEDDLLPAAREHGVDVVVAGVYNSGILSSSTIAEDARYQYQEADPAVIARARAIADCCARYDVDLPAAAVQFALRRAEVKSVVLGTGTVAHVAGSLERASAEIPDALWDELAASGLLMPSR